MAFAVRLPEELDTWLNEASRVERRSKNAIVVAALAEYRQQHEIAHVMELARETQRDHATLTDWLGDT